MFGRLGTRIFSMHRIRRGLLRNDHVALLLVAAVAAAIMFTGPPPAAPLYAPPSAPALHHAISVYDGDTIRLGDERIRIVGLDTPERGHRAECESEALAAEVARQALIGEIAQGKVALHRQGTDRYGRTLARVTVDGRDVAGTLIAQGLARPYEGGRRQSWCS